MLGTRGAAEERGTERPVRDEETGDPLYADRRNFLQGREVEARRDAGRTHALRRQRPRQGTARL